MADLITLSDEKVTTGRSYTFYHPFAEGDFFVMKPEGYASCTPMLHRCMQGGKRCGEKPTLRELQSEVQKNLDRFHPSYLRQINPHIYKVSLSSRLKKLKMQLTLQQRKLGMDGQED